MDEHLAQTSHELSFWLTRLHTALHRNEGVKVVRLLSIMNFLVSSFMTFAIHNNVTGMDLLLRGPKLSLNSVPLTSEPPLSPLGKNKKQTVMGLPRETARRHENRDNIVTTSIKCQWPWWLYLYAPLLNRLEPHVVCDC